MIVEGGKKYSVKLIPQTCNREDAIREIVSALDHLNSVSDEVFSTIRTRIQSHGAQVGALSRRVAAASEQVSSLKGSQKAIRIISPAKYPCQTPNPSGSTIISETGFPTLIAKNVPEPIVVEEDEETRCQRPLRLDSSIKHPNDLLSIFHVKESKLADLNQLDNVADFGLGKPPQTIRNMDSFFLFNTIENPYTNYKMTERSQDRNFGTLRPTRKGEEVHAEICPIVPETVDEGKPELDDFYYYPSTVEIPNIDVPESLPDLPGIADTFDLTDDPFTLNFPSKPAPSVTLQAPPHSNKSQDSTAPYIVPVSSTAPAVPLTSQPTSSSSAMQGERTGGSPHQQGGAPAVPPPPPPPPPEDIDVIQEVKKTVPPPISSSGGDVRSSLMAAIRDAGGSGKAKLKSAKDRKYEAKKKKQDEKEQNISNELQEGGDLMSDLKNKLAMRRRGISGIQGAQKQIGGVGDIMLSLASAIPTLDSSVETTGAAEGSDNDDDDWD